MADRTPAKPRPRSTIKSRGVPMLFVVLGLTMVLVTQAVQRGLITGIAVDWPAYIVGGVLIVLGVVGIGAREEEPPPALGDPNGPIRESGRDPASEASEEDLREILRRMAESERSRAMDRDH